VAPRQAPKALPPVEKAAQELAQLIVDRPNDLKGFKERLEKLGIPEARKAGCAYRVREILLEKAADHQTRRVLLNAGHLNLAEIVEKFSVSDLDLDDCRAAIQYDNALRKARVEVPFDQHEYLRTVSPELYHASLAQRLKSSIGQQSLARLELRLARQDKSDADRKGSGGRAADDREVDISQKPDSPPDDKSPPAALRSIPSGGNPAAAYDVQADHLQNLAQRFAKLIVSDPDDDKGLETAVSKSGLDERGKLDCATRVHEILLEKAVRHSTRCELLRAGHIDLAQIVKKFGASSLNLDDCKAAIRRDAKLRKDEFEPAFDQHEYLLSIGRLDLYRASQKFVRFLPR
jgi:hypothetical protein